MRPALGTIFDVENLKKEIQNLQTEIEQEGYSDAVKEKSKVLKHKTMQISQWQEIEKILNSLSEVEKMKEEEFEILQEDIEKQIKETENMLEKAEHIFFLNGKYDSNDAIFEIHVGNGGDDAEDFVSILLRMYLRFFEQKGWKVEILDEHKTEAGIKNVAIQVEGENVYGFLQYEKGNHKLYRKSPFKANNSRQTSFTSVMVTPIVENKDIEIKNDDLEITTCRASGAGGQKVNKTDSAVRIKHIPSGIVVQCQTQRSQGQNKQWAMTMLRSKLFELSEEQKEKEISGIKGSVKKANFGSEAIRIYILDTPKKIKDYRTDFEMTNIQDVLDGNIEPFLKSTLVFMRSNK